MKLRSSLQEQFLRVKKKNRQQPKLKNTFFPVRDLLWEFHARASRMPVLGLWAPRRKTKAQNRRTSLFVNQRFQHKHTNWAHLSLWLSSGLDPCLEPQVPPVLSPFSRKKKKKRWGGSLISFMSSFLSFLFFFTFIKCPVKYLTQVCSFQIKSWLILEVKPSVGRKLFLILIVSPKSHSTAPAPTTFLRIFNLLSLYFSAST